MEHTLYLSSIKRALKTKGMSYAELARLLRMTESGVKKMLNAKDISLRRILQIAEVLGVNPSQLLQSAEQSEIPILRLSDKQEQALIKDLDLLAVFWRLTVENQSLEQISRAQGISLDKTQKLLLQLSKLDLAILTKEKILPMISKKFRLDDSSPLAKKLNREGSMATLNKSLNQTGQGFHRLITIKMSTESFTKFIQEGSDFLEEFVRLSEREELSYPSEKLNNVSALLAMAPSGLLDKQTVPF